VDRGFVRFRVRFGDQTAKQRLMFHFAATVATWMSNTGLVSLARPSSSWRRRFRLSICVIRLIRWSSATNAF
jgi:hypothetical protein